VAVDARGRDQRGQPLDQLQGREGQLRTASATGLGKR
jgi:hypothetical protein